MAHFYGTVTGAARTSASRLGHKRTGLETRAASWSGAIQTRVWHNEETGLDYFEVIQTPHHGAGISQILASGVIGRECESAGYPRYDARPENEESRGDNLDVTA